MLIGPARDVGAAAGCSPAQPIAAVAAKMAKRDMQCFVKDIICSSVGRKTGNGGEQAGRSGPVGQPGGWQMEQ